MNETIFALATAERPCVCSQANLVVWDESGDPENATYIDTGCTETTKRVFAPGHDAKLKGLLIRAGVEGLDAQVGGISADPVRLAEHFGFAALVAQGITNGLAKADAKRAAAAAKASKQASKAAAKPKPAKKASSKKAASDAASDESALEADAKVGRWVKHGTYNRGTGEFTYRDSTGAQVTVTKYTNLNLH